MTNARWTVALCAAAAIVALMLALSIDLKPRPVTHTKEVAR